MVQEVQWEATWLLTIGRNSAHRKAGHLASLSCLTVVAPSGVSLGAPEIFSNFSLLRSQGWGETLIALLATEEEKAGNTGRNAIPMGSRQRRAWALGA